MADLPAQVIGDKVPLGTTAVDSPSTGTKPVDLQRVGTSIEMSRTPISSPSALASKGTYQIIGDMVALGHTPTKEIGNSTALPFSGRAKLQSDVGSIPKASVTRP